ncbi:MULTISPECIES: hypothetical protein [unclassified Caballeronia]|uniref:hypothetical protein n=1 Tax=unclassified Caballeronia TaxID=2646786 RepID=UPI0028566268|nr:MULTISPECIES: hypothetical protein [unclassified Caballeronia]MDR5739141.1 hypothetical protein [Caballeronia sp. LZ016]MDR5807629.1 hypothetical protein [Caballeronia sp. LZ019]
MKLAFLTMAFVLGSSPVVAAPHYTEVWNPPEVHVVKGKSKAHGASRTAGKKKRKSASAVKQVADKASIDQPVAAPPRKGGSPKQAEPVIPRKIDPNGQVMRV